MTTHQATPLPPVAPAAATVPPMPVPAACGMSASIISAIERIQIDQVTKSGGGGVVDVLKGISVGYLGERDSHVRRIADLETEIAQTQAQRDVAVAKLGDLRDINILHSLTLALGTGLLGCYASYDSAGKGTEFAILLYLGIGCVFTWAAFLAYRIRRS